MEFRSQQRTAAPRGGAAIVILNIIVLLLIVGLGGGYYYIQMRPKRAIGEFDKAREYELKGHISSAELHYRKAVHLDPGNIQYQRSLDALVRGEGNLKEIEMENLSTGPRSASADLFPKEARLSSTPSLAGVAPEKEKPAPVEVAPPPPPKPVAVPSTVAIEVVAPGAAEFEIRAVNVENEVPGATVEPWSMVGRPVIREFLPGEYEVAVRAAWADPVVERFTVKGTPNETQDVKFEFGLLKVGGEPLVVQVSDKASGKKVGQTPLVMLLQPGRVALILEAEGFDSVTLEGDVEARGTLHFNHRLLEAGTTPAAVVKREPVKKPDSIPLPEVAAGPDMDTNLAAVAKLVPKPLPPPVTVPSTDPEPSSAPAPARETGITVSTVQPTVSPWDKEPGNRGSLAKVEAMIARRSAEKPVQKAQPVLGREPVLGSSFKGPEGVIYLFGERSHRGDPFWMSRSAPLAGRSQESAREYCARLTDSERAVGRVPDGYGYYPSLAGDGRIALCVEYVHRGGAAVEKAKPTMKAEVLPTKRPLVISSPPASAGVTGEYRSHVAGGSSVTAGESFLNGDRVWMEYGKTDAYGNHFWISASGVVNGMSETRANQHCWDLTKRERDAGRIPGGYRYSPIRDGSGKVVLGRTVQGNASAVRR